MDTMLSGASWNKFQLNIDTQLLIVVQLAIDFLWLLITCKYLEKLIAVIHTMYEAQMNIFIVIHIHSILSVNFNSLTS